MKVKALLLLTAALVGSGALAGEVGFSTKPRARRAGGKTVITFAVKKATDVEVAILDGGGKAIRHLAAGALGGKKAPPAPLKPGLSQTVEWDGRADCGKPATGGPFRVRVALGLGAKFDRVLLGDRQHLGGVSALCAGPDGTLYVFSGFGASVPNWPPHHLLLAFARSGKYLRTVLHYVILDLSCPLPLRSCPTAEEL